MKILGMDTSSPSGSVALLDGNNLVSESLIEGSPAYSDKLLFEIDAMLNDKSHAYWDKKNPTGRQQAVARMSDLMGMIHG